MTTHTTRPTPTGADPRPIADPAGIAADVIADTGDTDTLAANLAYHVQSVIARSRPVYGLARLADCPDPDGPDSPGARVLSHVADGVADVFAYMVGDCSDMVAHVEARLADGETGDDIADDFRAVGTYDALDIVGDMVGDPYPEDRLHEVADGAPSIYTAQLFAELADIAYAEDPAGEYGEVDGDMTRQAGIAVYMVADRLAHALAYEVAADVLGTLADGVADIARTFGAHAVAVVDTDGVESFAAEDVSRETAHDIADTLADIARTTWVRPGAVLSGVFVVDPDGERTRVNIYDV